QQQLGGSGFNLNSINVNNLNLGNTGKRRKSQSGQQILDKPPSPQISSPSTSKPISQPQFHSSSMIHDSYVTDHTKDHPNYIPNGRLDNLFSTGSGVFGSNLGLVS